MYLLHRLRRLGFTARVIEAGGDVGGTWYWNRYPGARCDIQSVDYSYSFDPELDETWTWSEKYAPQPEILRYAQHVADEHDLRRDIQFDSRVERRCGTTQRQRWQRAHSQGDEVTCRFYVMATGCLSMPKEVDIEGAERFEGDVYFTSRWPHEGVDFTGKRVAVIGTGSSAHPVDPAHRRTGRAADRLPAHAQLLHPRQQRAGPRRTSGQRSRTDRGAYREAASGPGAASRVESPTVSAFAVTDEERLGSL